MKIMDSMLNDVDSFYERLERNEKLFKERSSQEASCRELSANIESILTGDPVNLPALKIHLENAKISEFGGLIDPEIIAHTESELKEAASMLSTISVLLQLYTEKRTKANELALTHTLEHARRFRDEDIYLEAREYVLLHSAEDDASVTETNLEAATVLPGTTETFAVMDFEYVRKSLSGVRWLGRLESEFTSEKIPPGFEQSIASIMATHKSVKIQNAQDLIPRLSRVSSALKCIDERIDNKTVIMTLLFLLNTIFSEIPTRSSKNEVLEFSLLLRAAFATLGKGLRKVFESLLLSIIHKSDLHSVPNFGVASEDPERKLLVLYGSLIESEELESFSAKNGWAWIVRASKQMFILQKNMKYDAVSECCVSMLTVLQYCGGLLLRQFGSKFFTLLEKLCAVLLDCDTPSAARLREFIQSNVLEKKTYCSVTLLNIPAHVLSACVVLR